MFWRRRVVTTPAVVIGTLSRMSDTDYRAGDEVTLATVRLQRGESIPATEFSADVDDLVILVALAAFVGSEDVTGFDPHGPALDQVEVEYAKYGSPFDVDFVALGETARALWNGAPGMLAAIGVLAVAFKNFHAGQKEKIEASIGKYDLKERKRKDAAEALRRAASDQPLEARVYEKLAKELDSGKYGARVFRAVENATESSFDMKIERGGIHMRYRRRRFEQLDSSILDAELSDDTDDSA